PAGKPSRVSSYRYPQPADAPALTGPEQVYRIHLARPVANFGVAVLSGAVTPRIVAGGDENRLAGYTALPIDLNPYRSSYGNATPVVGTVLPGAGDYDVVFETAPGKAPGRFTFRFWTDDTTPPRIVVPKTVTSRSVPITITDAGSGVDPATLRLLVDGQSRTAKLRAGLLRVPLARGRHVLRVTVSD